MFFKLIKVHLLVSERYIIFGLFVNNRYKLNKCGTKSIYKSILVTRNAYEQSMR